MMGNIVKLIIFSCDIKCANSTIVMTNQ
jgi:hypothetical protein